MYGYLKQEKPIFNEVWKLGLIQNIFSKNLLNKCILFNEKQNKNAD